MELNDVLSILIFIAPFIAITFLFFAKAAEWRQRMVIIWAFTSFMAFGWYILLLWSLRKIESVDIVGLRLNPEGLPLYTFISSSWQPFSYAGLIVVLGYLALHYSSRNASGRSG